MEKYRGLNAVIKVSGIKKTTLAAELGINRSTLSLKLHGKLSLTLSEGLKLAEILGLSPEEFEALIVAPSEGLPAGEGGCPDSIRAHIKRAGGMSAVAAEMGISRSSLQRKLNGTTEITVTEACAMSRALGLTIGETIELIEKNLREKN